MFCFKRSKKKPEKTKEEYLEAIQKNVLSMVFAPTQFWRDEDFFYKALKIDSLVFLHTPKSILKDKSKFIQAIQTQKDFFRRFLSRSKFIGKNIKPFTTNVEIMENAVKIDGMNFIYAHKNIKDKKRLALEAVKQNSRVFYWLKELQKDPDIIYEASKTYDDLVFYVNHTHRNTPEIAANIIKHFPHHMAMFSEELTHDTNFIKPLIKANPEVLRYAQCFNKSHKKVILDLVKINPASLKYASPSLRNNLDYNLKLAQINGSIFPFLESRFKKNPYFQLRAIQSGLSLEEISPYLSYEPQSLNADEVDLKKSNRDRLYRFFQVIENTACNKPNKSAPNRSSAS